MTAGWPDVALGTVIHHRSDFITIDDTAIYRRPRVQLHAQGIVLRDQVSGALIKTKKQQVARAGELLVAEIDAKVGGFGIVPDELDGVIVSSHYFLFQNDPDQLDGRFLGWFVKTPFFRGQVVAQGSTNYAAIRAADVLGYTIPLPPIEEQRRVVARVEMALAKIGNACGLRKQTITESEALLRSILFEDKSAASVPMGELVCQRPPDVNVQASDTYNFAGVYSFGRGVFRGIARQGLEFSYARLSRLKTNDLIYPKLMAWEGALGVVPESCAGLFVSPEFPVFEIDQTRVLPEVLDVYYRTPSVWPKLSGESTGTNVRRRRLNPSDFLKYHMPLPSMRTQLLLREVKKKTDTMKQHYAETFAELEAMGPAILDKAFRGDL